MIENTLYKKNGFLIALFLLQYTLWIPLMSFINPSILTAISTMLIVLICIIKNCKQNANIYVLGMFTIVFLLLLLKSIQPGTDIYILVNYLTIAGPAMVIFLFSFDIQEFLRWAMIFAKVGFWMICWNPFIGNFSYMRFGYGMLPVVLLTYIDLFYYADKTKVQKLYNFCIIIVGLIEIILYGARGAVFSLLLFIFIERFCIRKKRIILNAILIISAFLIYNNILPILNTFEKLSKEIGIYSYSITKFKMQIVSGFDEASSGRDILYQNALQKIREHPWIGNPIKIDEDGGNYVHNLFLQIGQDIGVICLVVLIILLVYMLIYIWFDKIEISQRLMGTLLFSIAVGRLMFSSTIWRRPEFWMLLFFFCAMWQKKIFRNLKSIGNSSAPSR